MAPVTSPEIRFTVKEYFRMSEAGLFDGRRVELIDGRIYRMHAQANPHIASISKSNIVFVRHFGNPSKFWLAVQSTYVIEKNDAPDPDLYVRKCPVSTPDEKLPQPFIVVEVSHTTYRRDSGIKLRRYAAAGVQDYWIVNIKAKRVEVYRKPENPTGKKKDWAYASVEFYHPGEKVKLLAYPKIQIAVSEMLP